MVFVSLFLVALVPVLKVLIITGVGSFLALDRINILVADARHHLNNRVFYLLSPALIGSYLAESITLESLSELWFMPVNILLTFIIGSILAWILNKIAKTPHHLRGLVVGCCSAGNLGNLLLVIVPAVCSESDSPFGDETDCTTSADAYVTLSMAVGAVYIWSYVYVIMRMSISKSIDPDENHNLITTETSGSISWTSTEPLLPSVVSEANNSTEVQVSNGNKVSVCRRIMEQIKVYTKEINLKMLFAPSIIAAIIGFIIGIIPLLRNAFIGDDAPLYVVESSVYLLGEACVPAMTLIIGANLVKGLRSSGAGVVAVLGVILVRYLALPVIGIGVVKAANKLGIVGSDPLYQFVLMLQFALPPAMNVGECECSVIMLWTYAVATLSLTLWSMCFMWIVS